MASLTYELEEIPASDKAQARQAHGVVNEGKTKPYKVDWPVSENQTERRTLYYDDLNTIFTDILDRRAGLVADAVKSTGPRKKLSATLDEYLSRKTSRAGFGDAEGALPNARSDWTSKRCGRST